MELRRAFRSGGYIRAGLFLALNLLAIILGAMAGDGDALLIVLFYGIYYGPINEATTIAIRIICGVGAALIFCVACNYFIVRRFIYPSLRARALPPPLGRPGPGRGHNPPAGLANLQGAVSEGGTG